MEKGENGDGSSLTLGLNRYTGNDPTDKPWFMVKTFLAGDIGGTKTLLQLLQTNDRESPTLLHSASFPSQHYPDLGPLVRAFWQQTQSSLGNGTNLPHPTVACFAIAGPVVDNTCELTNLAWHLNGDRLEKELNLAKVSLINDFAAVGYGILGLTSTDLHYLQTGRFNPQAPKAVIGAGTGLGQGFLIPQGDSYQIFNSEGGHSDFAPRSQEEFQLLSWVKNQYQLERVSTERLVSGLGITHIYQYLRQQYPAQESPALGEIYQQWCQGGEMAIDLGAVIGDRALQQDDELCERAMALFVSLYGAEAGNLALKLLPYGGLYVAGGIAPKILPLMERYHFLKSFLNKGRMATILKNIPVAVITNAQVGLMGAAIRARQLTHC